MSELPEGWTTFELRECVDVLDNVRVPVNSDERSTRRGTVPYYGATGQVGWIDDYLFDEELLLIGEDGAPFLDKSKPIAYIINGRSWVNNHAHVLRAKDGIATNTYLKHLLNQFDFHEYVNGTTRLKLTQGALNRIPVRLAPPDEQRRIVAKLEEVLAKVEACQKRLAKIPVILKRFRQSVLATACSGRLTADWRDLYGFASDEPLRLKSEGDALPEIPNGWTWVRLPELGNLGRGKSRHRPRDAAHLYGGPYPFIQTGDIARSCGRLREHRQTYSEAGLAQSKLWPKGTVCITIAANIADSAILTYPACFPDSVVGLLCDNRKCLAEYAEFFIRIARDDLSQFAPATAQKNINLAILNDVMVPLPSLTEQQEIVRCVEALFKFADQIEARYKKAQGHVDKLPQSILAKAFRGELVPTEAELARREGRDYESASVLLERIRREHGESTVSSSMPRPRSSLTKVRGLRKA